ncbi:acyltransferase [Lacticaseibacillus paracasei]|uniref:acyltransferase n=1 Tax=Lacticaseibacillus paracasei TaxID=1597 RepID=UPI002729DFEF|nr:acyltransferase [Lacticaseibacillus paracasei]WKZ95466.1 acyltransferase [Lacticaseibacillus paracasei]
MKRKLVMLNLLLKRDGNARAKYLKNKNIFFNMGKHCYWHPFKIPSEPYLLNLHNNVVVASNVTFVTHDIIDYMLNYKLRNQEIKPYIGPIEIFDNVFIGSDSIILYDTKIGPNAIVAAGSVVVKDVPEGTIVGGNPARVIGHIDSLIKKRKRGQYPDRENGVKNIIDFYWNRSGEKL